jgi:hypothetical protein
LDAIEVRDLGKRGIKMTTLEEHLAEHRKIEMKGIEEMWERRTDHALLLGMVGGILIGFMMGFIGGAIT